MPILYELDLTITSVGSARTEHTCAYCRLNIKKGQKYTKLTVRMKGERFAKDYAVCKDHQPAMIPLSVLLNEQK